MITSDLHSSHIVFPPLVLTLLQQEVCLCEWQGTGCWEAVIPVQFSPWSPGNLWNMSQVPKKHVRCRTQRVKKSLLYPPSSSTPLSPALTPHLNSEVKLFISLPHPIKGAWYKRMKLDFFPGYWRIRVEVEAAVSNVCEPRWSSSRCKDKIGGQPTL